MRSSDVYMPLCIEDVITQVYTEVRSTDVFA